jgi:uncharacterized repeat protein (TIGR03803 family)
MTVAPRGLALAISAMTIGGWASHAPVEMVVYSFGSGSDGGIPYAGVIYEHGAFYGATDIGGGTGCGGLGCGYIYQLTPPANGGSSWTKSVLHAFSGDRDGAYPQARLTFGAQGILYGTTTAGGAFNAGTVFALTPPAAGKTGWTEAVLHSFSGRDGEAPHGALVLDKPGNLYGTTELGGSRAQGVVYRLVRPQADGGKWDEFVLHEFTGRNDGGTPLGGVIADRQGNLYGTTMTGGAAGQGIVFQLTPPPNAYTQWPETVLHDFAGGSDGAQPVAGLAADSRGALYGATTQGGPGTCTSENGCGTVFRLTPPANGQTQWTEAVLHGFLGGADGSFPNSVVTVGSDGTLVGATQLGGSNGCEKLGCGTIFRLTPPAGGGTSWSEAIVKQFNGGADGAYPTSVTMVPHQGGIFGTTSQGGLAGCDSSSCGVVFKLGLNN